MRIGIAPDSFKESMTSLEAAEAIARGIHSVDSSIECDLIPLADGGEGTARTLTTALGGQWLTVPCHDALLRPSMGGFGFVPDQRLAFIDVAEALGLGKVRPTERDPWLSSSWGAGDLIRAALDAGASQFIIGLGGTATNDAGSGLLTALGARFVDDNADDIPAGARGLSTLAAVNLSGLDVRFRDASIRIASDVTNPLLGPTGASAVFGPQKGATDRDIDRLDGALAQWADIIEAATGLSVRHLPGAGAAGGIAAALAAFSNATLEAGIDLVMDAVRFRDRIIGADWVFTGEGSIDAQTASGKTLWGVSQACAAANVKAVLFGGRVSDDAYCQIGEGAVAVVPILPYLCDLPTALQQGPRNLERAAAMATRLIVSH